MTLFCILYIFYTFLRFSWHVKNFWHFWHFWHFWRVWFLVCFWSVSGPCFWSLLARVRSNAACNCQQGSKGCQNRVPTWPCTPKPISPRGVGETPKSMFSDQISGSGPRSGQFYTFLVNLVRYWATGRGTRARMSGKHVFLGYLWPYLWSIMASFTTFWLVLSCS